jgi:site-specific recombinase XerD
MTPTFDILIQDFFCRRLIEQQGVSPRTVEAYRDTFRLLLAYLPKRLGKAMNDLTLADLDAANVIAFLDHLQTERGNGARTRNARLAVLRSFAPYAAARARRPCRWPIVCWPSRRSAMPNRSWAT